MLICNANVNARTIDSCEKFYIKILKYKNIKDYNQSVLNEDFKHVRFV